jgi:hypothetical protein
MIDKTDLSRNYKISKDKGATEKKQFDAKTSSYSSITHEVFGIISSDYHSELYSTLHARYEDAEPEDNDRQQIKNFDTGYFVTEKALEEVKPWKGRANSCSLPTYVRNCINHPDSGNTFTPEELEESIKLMIGFL